MHQDDERTGLTDPIGHERITAGFGQLLADAIVGAFSYIETARCRSAERRARERHVTNTEKLLAKLPSDIRGDIGWPMRPKKV